MNWQIQEAKARFSEMAERALKEGPQTVTRHGKPVAVVVPVNEYQRMRTGGKGFKALLASAPLAGSRLGGRAAPGEWSILNVSDRHHMISEISKDPRCNPNVAAWYRTAGNEELFLSVLVIG